MSTTGPRIPPKEQVTLQNTQTPAASSEINNNFNIAEELSSDNTDGYEGFIQELFQLMQMPNASAEQNTPLTLTEQTSIAENTLPLNDVFNLPINNNPAALSSTQNQPNYLELLGLVTNDTNDSGQQAAFQQAFDAYISMLTETQGQQTQLQNNNPFNLPINNNPFNFPINNNPLNSPFNNSAALPSIQNQPNYLELVGLLTNETNNLGQQAAFQQALSAYTNALTEVQGQQAQLQINNESTEAQAILDQQMLALRNNYLILSKQLEQYTLDAQTRERITNLLFELTFNQTTNRFQLARTVVNAAKY